MDLKTGAKIVDLKLRLTSSTHNLLVLILESKAVNSPPPRPIQDDGVQVIPGFDICLNESK